MRMHISEYAALLLGHDWFYSYADDHNAYRQGREERLWLQDLARTEGPDFMALWAFQLNRHQMA